jgi:hypothetical protein
MHSSRRTKTLLGLLLLLSQAFSSPSDAFGFTHFRYMTVNCVRRPVAVENARGTYTADFQHAMILYPNGRADGTLLFTAADGSERYLQIYAAQVHWRAESEHEVQRLRLQARELGTQPGPEVAIIIYPTPPNAAGEDCLIYTTIGTQVYNATFAVESRLTVVR